MPICDKCGRMDADISAVHHGSGVITYECFSSSRCGEIARDALKKQDDLDKIERNKYNHLPKAQQVLARYKVNFSDLDLSLERYRDASEHYIHRQSRKKYSWCFSGNYWYVNN